MLFFFQFTILRGMLKVLEIYMVDTVKTAEQCIDSKDKELWNKMNRMVTQIL
jgi:hypothetical protein